MKPDTTLWFAVGLAISFLLCGTGHAADPSQRFEPQCWIFEHNTVRWASCEDAWTIRTDVEPPCLQRMEDAMRAMKPYLDPYRSSEIYDGCNTCDVSQDGLSHCTLLHCSGPHVEVSRLEWELAQAKKRAEWERERSNAKALWETVEKECWRP